MKDSKIVAQTDVIVDGDLSSEKMVKLIRLQREEERLDYKRAYNLSGKKATKDKVEIVRDVVAMANTHGGYILLGVEEKGEGKRKYEPMGISDEIFKELDIDRLRSQIEKYIVERIDFRLQIHSLKEYGNRRFAFIFISKTDKSPIIFEKPGGYEDENNPGTQLFAFRSGEIHIRKGASSTRADQSDMRRIISQIRRREQARWTEEILGLRELTDRLDTLIEILSKGEFTPKKVRQDNYDESHFYLSGQSFEDRILNLLEGNKYTTIRRYLQSAPTSFFKQIESINDLDDDAILLVRDNNLLPLLDNLLLFGKIFTQYDDNELFKDLERAFYQVCKQAHSYKFPRTNDTSLHFNSSWVWKEVIKRIYALGGLLILEKKTEWIPFLIRQSINWDSYYKPYFWARYFLTMLSRERRLEEKSLCRLSVAYLIEDFPDFTEAFMGDEDDLISTICQFDYLQCIHVIVETKDIFGPFPSFGIYNNHRTEPIIANLIQNGEFRNSIPKISDDTLAEIVRGLDNFAGKEFIRYNGWDSNYWSDIKIKTFLSQHSQNADY